MMKLLISFVFTVSSIVSLNLPVFASDSHDHKPNSKNEKDHGDHEEDGDKGSTAKPDDHGEHDEHGDHDEVGEHEEENAQVGPEKGIIEANKEKGFKLSAEAEKNFEIKKIKLTSNSLIELPSAAVARSAMEVNLYRIREGFYKRIDFKYVKRSSDKIVVNSIDLKAGDEVAISGLGFLRISEIAAFDGAPEGHSH